MIITKNKKILSITFILSVLLFSCNKNNTPKKPNIIIILTDDQGWTDSSVRMMENRDDSKSDFYETPNLERLAEEGLVFSNAYAPAPVCTPTRYSILYGKSPARLKHSTLKGWYASPEKEVSIPKMIKSGNTDYVTAHFGKWHQPLAPADVGYDVSDGPTGNADGDWLSPGVLHPPDDPKQTFSISERACDFIAEQVKKNTPFFMQVSYFAVHVQNYALESTKEKYRIKKPGIKSITRDFKLTPPPLNQGMIEYAAMVDDLDAGFGMILDKIDELGIKQNTYVIFTSDNGGGFRGNEPLKMGKADLWEGGIRVPTVVRGPKVLSGKYCDTPIVGWDFYPTISEIIANDNPLPSNLDGGSLISLFENGNSGTVNRENSGLVFHFPWFNGEPESAIRLGDYKLIKNIDSRKLWLFNLTNDIEERMDLSEQMPEKTIEMHNILENYLKNVDAEHVMDLRKRRRKIMVDESIPAQEKKRMEIKEKLKKEANSKKDILEEELQKVEKYLNWLRGEVIFTDERSKLHL